ncbi:MAG: type II/IV secretion system protein [bacterium]|nr:type II/IV secretion system protein [bacterium]
MRKKIRIGELLVANGIITQENLDDALAQHKKLGKRLGRTLVDLGFVEEQKFLTFLASQLSIQYVNLKEFKVDRELVLKLPETHARRLRAIVLEDHSKNYLVGMADPTDLFAFDELQGLLRRSVEVAVVREADLVRSIDLSYGRTEEIEQLAGELHEELADRDFDAEQLEIADDPTDAPVARLLQTVFEEAVRLGASDVHIEPDENVLRIRHRVDGVLQEQIVNEKRIANALVLRLKLMSNLDISEKRLPQDGRFNIRVRGSSIDVRLSTMPVQYGESVVMRLLDQSNEMESLEQLGVPKHILSRLMNLIHRPHGLILVTGPTGSGKTTTLYACLRELNRPQRKMITVEDPIEYRLPRIQQVQVHARIGLSFASVLRSALRQDPDVLMVGEMRDQETVEIGLRAAITGHLVFSTLHTNDAITTANRLVDMGAASYLVASALRAVIAQRLVRRICVKCRERYQPGDQERIWLASIAGPAAAKLELYHGKGCNRCGETGFRGRIGVYEMLEIDTACADALRRGDQAAFAAAARRSKGYRPLTLCALGYASQGITSLSEVFRVAETLEDGVLASPATSKALATQAAPTPATTAGTPATSNG